MTKSKKTDFSDWYTQVLQKSEMIDYYDVSGCYILRPWSFGVWELIQNDLDLKLKKDGVKNCYFPMFVTKEALSKEKEHLEGFSPEVAWVTKAGDVPLKSEIAIRPTSETIMYPSFKKWVQSHKDLPLLLNQWSNVVRWEFDTPMPFLRSREFLWQEGHTAFASKESAEDEVKVRLGQYAEVYQDLLAIPVIPGYKSEKEKFAGADYTMTVETFIADKGRAIQAATAHHLGQNFSKMFDITYSSIEDTKELVYQNSWGLSTRAIGAMVMMHSDDNGLVLPPRAAPVQVVIVPIHPKGNETVPKKAIEIKNILQQLGIRVHLDDRAMQPGKKFNHWELKGVPVRIEIGLKDLENNQGTLFRRDNSEKSVVSIDNINVAVPELLDNIHSSLFDKANQSLQNSTARATNMEEFLNVINEDKMALVSWCGDIACEEEVIAKSQQNTVSGPTRKAKSLCFPLAQPQEHPDSCFCCSKTNTKWAYFGKSY